jgi:hypothetical protein
MSLSGQQEALLIPLLNPCDTPVSAIYTAWRVGGSLAFIARHVITQLSMAFVLLLFFVSTVAINYHQLRARITNTICPGPTPNTASLFETDCWGNLPINMSRRTHPGIIFVICMVVLSMICEFILFNIALRKVRSAEAWWSQQHNHANHIHDWIKWEDICMFLELNPNEMSIVSSRGDFYNTIYTSILQDFSFCSHSLHRAINTSVYIYKRTTIPLYIVFPLMSFGSFIAIPYMAVGMLCHYFFRNFYNVRTRGIGFLMGRRTISLIAKWRLHKLDNPPHITEEHANHMEKLAVDYLNSIHLTKIMKSLLNTVLVCGGAFAALVFMLTLILGEKILTAELSPGRTVAFYTACVGVLMSSASAMKEVQPSGSRSEIIADMGLPYTDLWCHSARCKQIKIDFPYQVFTLGIEISSLLTTPLLLMTSLYCRSNQIQQVADIYF